MSEIEFGLKVISGIGVVDLPKADIVEVKDGEEQDNIKAEETIEKVNEITKQEPKRIIKHKPAKKDLTRPMIIAEIRECEGLLGYCKPSIVSRVKKSELAERLTDLKQLVKDQEEYGPIEEEDEEEDTEQCLSRYGIKKRQKEYIEQQVSPLPKISPQTMKVLRDVLNEPVRSQTKQRSRRQYINQEVNYLSYTNICEKNREDLDEVFHKLFKVNELLREIYERLYT